MRTRERPHVLGIDDGPVDKASAAPVAIVGVMMEGADLVEAVARTEFPLDGDDSARFLAEWVGALRCRPALQALVLGGITIAGLAVVDVADLAERLGLPVLVVNRRDPAEHRLGEALRAAGLGGRLAIVERTPPASRLDSGLWLAVAGAAPAEAERLVRATVAKSLLPEPLRVAHLVARAVASGESRGRP